MKQTGCENEERILEALGKGCALETFEEPLRKHVAGCASCSELVAVYEIFRRAASERAMRPILIVEKTALAVGGGVLIALLIFAAPWLAKQFGHTSMFSGTVVHTLPLTTLIVTSIIICLLVMAGALYALWAEK